MFFVSIEPGNKNHSTYNEQDVEQPFRGGELAMATKKKAAKKPAKKVVKKAAKKKK